ncbi:hypothetical protein [Ruminococcus sp. 5_1_39BFAA]|uniref:hypothetical protein n=1 Tax=Ruminococcus sp. 5_1_39BFAA TaxID=457412 RepID=UPI0035637A8D
MYLENHLEKESEEYVELIKYYNSVGRDSEAREVAERGLEKCKDDLTEIFIYLLNDAKKCGDRERYHKLYASAKRRKRADTNRIDAAINME